MIEVKYYKTAYGNYYISKCGKLINQSCHWSAKREVTVKLNKDNYPCAYLSLGEKQQIRPIHRIVAETFLIKPSDKHVVNHKNGLRADNRVENLEWLLPADNERHARRVLGKRCLGEKASRSKLTSKEVLEIRALGDKKISQKQIAAKYCVKQVQVSRILRRVNWAHI